MIWGLESPQNRQTRMSALRGRAVEAAPFPILCAIAEAGVYWVGSGIMAAAVLVFVVTNEMIVRLTLPKFDAGTMEHEVGLASGITFPVLENLAEGPARPRTEDGMNMIGHDNPGEQIETDLLVEAQNASDQIGDDRLLEPAVTVTSIEVSVHTI